MSATRLTRTLRFEAPAEPPASDAPIPCTIATSTPVARYGVLEVLDCTAGGVDLTRAPLPLIVAHDSSTLSIGLVDNLAATGDRVTGMVRFGTSAEAQQIRADVIAGIHRSLSVGYALLGEGAPVAGGAIYRWQPHEVSIVPVPADPAAGFFRSQTGVPNMTTITAPLATNKDEIVGFCRQYKAENLADGLIHQNATMEQTREAVINELARRDQAAGGHLNIRRSDDTSNLENDLIVNTMVRRMGGNPKGETLPRADFTSLAVRALQVSGQRVDEREGRDRIMQRAMHGTSDFPNLLGYAVGRVLHEAYDAAPAALKPIARLKNLPDFRDRSVVRLGGGPSLEKVNEHGEFKYGTIPEGVNAWRLATFGRILGLSRQAMINDDLGGFADLLTKFGQAAARREADELVTVLTAPPLIDGVALFDPSRSTLITKALSLTGLGLAVIAFRAQRDLDGGLMVQEPVDLIVPAALEMQARQLVASFYPATTTTTQPFQLSVTVEPRLDANSATAWYLAAGNQSALEYGYLDGALGVQISQEEGFETDGMKVKARLDFGCGWTTPVGWVKSTGATA